MTDGISEALSGTYFGKRRKHFLVCPCGWKMEIKYGFGTNITFEEFWEESAEHKKECLLFKNKE